jgi:hypothetical protein
LILCRECKLYNSMQKHFTLQVLGYSLT